MLNRLAFALLSLSSIACSSSPPPKTAARTESVKPKGAEENRAAEEKGRALFTHAWTKNDPESKSGDGLGPNFNGSSCSGCHNQGALGGAGGAHGNTFIFNGEMIPKSDRVGGFQRARANETDARLVVIENSGVEIDGGLERDRSVTDLLDLVRPAVATCLQSMKIETNAKFGSAFKELEIKFTVDEKGLVASAPVSKALKPKELECVDKALKSVTLARAARDSTMKWKLFAQETRGPVFTSGQRNPTALFGAGVLDTVPAKEIEANARSIEGHPEITGTVPRTKDGDVARFGWKGDVKDLDTFVTRACALEVGLEVPGMHQYGFDEANAVGLDLDKHDVKALTKFVRALPRPTEESSKEAKRGERVFNKVGCVSCHSEKVGEVAGIYSDLLLHDMGAGLADGGGYGGGAVNANDREWRTPPLWGARDSGPWMHDGRAQSLRDAVSFHGGEAARVRFAFEELREDDQMAIVTFLESLQSPPLYPSL